MARWNPLRWLSRPAKASEDADATKALAPTAAQTFTPAQVGTLVAATAQAARTDGTFQPLPRTEPQVPFGPGVPLTPAAIDPLRPDGRTEPRFNEYPVTSNLPGVGDRLVPWKVLRDAADAGGLPRRCIEIRKAEVTTLDWAITITKEAVEAAQADASDRPRAEIEQELRRKLSSEIVRCTQFWQKPDPGQDETFAEWVGKVLEEHFVLDAICIYPRRTYGGELYALEVLDGSCYSDDTEVLTRRGWMRFSETTADDFFATRNPKTHEFEWQQATYFHQAPSEEDLYHFTSKSLDILVTGNHRMLVTKLPRALGGSRHRDAGEVIVTAAELAEHGSGQASKIPMTSQWNAPDLNEFRLAASGRTSSMPFECSGDDFAAFMGAYLSEGCFTNGDQICITQDPKSKGFEAYRDLLARIFGRKVCHTGKSFVIGRRCLHDYLEQFGKAHEKYIPDVVKNMSARQIEIFWRFYMLGDGCYHGNREQIVTCSPRMAGDLQEVAQKIGKCANVSHEVFTTDTVMRDGRVIRAENKRDRYTIRLSNTQARTWAVKRVPYKGDVFCVSVPNEVLYVRRNGKAAWCGNTIKPLRDHRGGRPLPPNPAYQQILWGFPRGEFIADVDDDGQIINGYQADHLVYKRRNVRAHTPYGYSAVEQALEDIDVWLRRRKWIRDEYTEGTVPVAFLKNTGQSAWTPSQIREYETDLNDVYSGSTAARHRMRVLPPGFEPEMQDEFGEKYKPEYDLFLIKQISSHFDVTIAELGFTETGGLGSTGWHEGQAAVQQRKATLPTLRWLQQLFTAISRSHLRMPPELEFRFLGLEEEDEASADEVAAARVADGRMTYNEDRDRMGMPRYDFPEADMPLVKTARGLVFLAGASELAPAGEMVGPVQGPPQADVDADGVLDAPHGPDTNTSGKAGQDDGGDDGTADEGDDRAEAVKTELAAYRRWSRRNPTPARPFAFQTVTKADAPDLATAPVTFATPGGDDRPKGEPVSWPGWHRDQETATFWGNRLQHSLAQAVGVERIAERWLAQELVKADEPDPTAVDTYQQPTPDDHSTEWAVPLAVAFLAAQGITLTAPIAAALAGIWAEGWAIGDAAARAVLNGRDRARFPWRTGDDQAARQSLTTTMAEALQAFLDQSRTTVPAIAERRLRAFARVLADAKARGLTARQLAQALRDALADDAWVRMVTLTELTRASSAAARATYTAAGITTWQWATEPGACPICTANQDAGPRVIGEAWPDGSAFPPAHPHCRCYVLPETDQV